MVMDRSVADAVFELQPDSCIGRLLFVNTQMLMKNLDEPVVRKTLTVGYVWFAFDSKCDPAGFVFLTIDGKNKYTVGSDTILTDGLRLRSESLFSGIFNILHNDTQIHHSRCPGLFMVTKFGVYRIEVLFKFPDEYDIWILSHPVYVGLRQPQKR